MTPTASWVDYRVRAGSRLLLDVPRLQLDGPGLVLVLGATGSGKSTLLRSATGLLEGPTGLHVEGEARIDGNGRIGFLPQDPFDAFLSFDAEHEFLLRSLESDRTRTEAREAASARLEMLGLADRAGVPFERLSGGERKRVALEAVQTHGPDVLLIDEPFNHLDATWAPRFTQALVRTAQESLVLVATHEPGPLLASARRAIVIRAGAPAFDGPTDDLRRRAGEFPEVALDPVPASRPAPVAGPVLVRLDDVRFQVGPRTLLDGASATFGPGVHVILGPNGSGKTTILRLLMGLDRPQSGHIWVARVDPTVAGPVATSRVAALHFEDPSAAFFAATVRQEIAFAPHNQDLPSCDVEARTREAAADFDLDDHLARHPMTLSGGERERVALACLAAARTRVVLLDEPTHGLDPNGRRLLYGLLHRLAPTTCILVATHDEDVARRAHSLHRLDGGRLQPVGLEVTPRTPS